MRVQIGGRAGVEPSPVLLDRRPHGLRVRGEQERVEVTVAGVERELRAHARPAGGRGGGRGRLLAATAAGDEGERGPRSEQLLACDLHARQLSPRGLLTFSLQRTVRIAR